MVIDSPCVMDTRISQSRSNGSGKDLSNPLIVDSLLKTIWFSTHHIWKSEELASPQENGLW